MPGRYILISEEAGLSGDLAGAIAEEGDGLKGFCPRKQAPIFNSTVQSSVNITETHSLNIYINTV